MVVSCFLVVVKFQWCCVVLLAGVAFVMLDNHHLLLFAQTVKTQEPHVSRQGVQQVSVFLLSGLVVVVVGLFKSC